MPAECTTLCRRLRHPALIGGFAGALLAVLVAAYPGVLIGGLVVRTPSAASPSAAAVQRCGPSWRRDGRSDWRLRPGCGTGTCGRGRRLYGAGIGAAGGALAYLVHWAC